MDRPRDDDAAADIDTDLVEYVIVGVPGLTGLDQVGTALAELVGAQAIRILDVVTLVKGDDGSVEVLEVDDVDSLRDLRQVGGSFGGLLSSNDLGLAAESVAPGTAALLLLAEDRWAGPLSLAARAAGGRVLAGERVQRVRISPALADAAGFTAPSEDYQEDVPDAAHREIP